MCAEHHPETRPESLGHLLNHATKALRAVFTEKLAPYGLTAAQWAVLATIARLEGAGRPDEINAAVLGARLQVDRTTMSGIIRRLARDSWVRVRPHPSDRRARVISLTARARKLMPVFDSLREETIDQASRGMDEADLATLKTLLERIIKNLTTDSQNR